MSKISLMPGHCHALIVAKTVVFLRNCPCSSCGRLACGQGKPASHMKRRQIEKVLRSSYNKQ